MCFLEGSFVDFHLFNYQLRSDQTDTNCNTGFLLTLFTEQFYNFYKTELLCNEGKFGEVNTLRIFGEVNTLRMFGEVNTLTLTQKDDGLYSNPSRHSK